MMIKLFRMSLLLFITIFGVNNWLYSQSENADSSVIVMTEEELLSFLTKIANAKKEQLKAKEYQQKLDQLQYDQGLFRGNANVSTSYENRDVFYELNALNEKLDFLLSQQTSTTVGANSRQVQTFSNTQNIEDLERQIRSLQEELRVMNQLSNLNLNNSNFNYAQDIAAREEKIRDLTYSLNRERGRMGTVPVVIQDKGKNTTPNPSLKDSSWTLADSSNIQKQLAALSQQIEVLRKGITTDNSSSKNREIDSLMTVVSDLNEKLNAIHESHSASNSTFKTSVYFENNESAIQSKYIPQLKQMALDAKDTESVNSIVIRGYSSNTGSSQYNKYLSFLRAEAVRKWFLTQGIDEKIISVIPNGIDYDAKGALGRRVEVILQ